MARVSNRIPGVVYIGDTCTKANNVYVDYGKVCCNGKVAITCNVPANTLAPHKTTSPDTTFVGTLSEGARTAANAIGSAGRDALLNAPANAGVGVYNSVVKTGAILLCQIRCTFDHFFDGAALRSCNNQCYSPKASTQTTPQSTQPASAQPPLPTNYSSCGTGFICAYGNPLACDPEGGFIPRDGNNPCPIWVDSANGRPGYYSPGNCCNPL